MSEEIDDNLRDIWGAHDIRTAEDALYWAKESYPELKDEEILAVWDDHYEVTGMEEWTENEKLSLRAKIRVLETLPYTHAYTGELGKLVQKSYVEYSVVLDLMNKLKKELKTLSK